MRKQDYELQQTSDACSFFILSTDGRYQLVTNSELRCNIQPSPFKRIPELHYNIVSLKWTVFFKELNQCRTRDVIFHTFFFLVKTWSLHYPQFYLTANRSVGDSGVFSSLRLRRGLVTSLPSNCTPPDFLNFLSCSLHPQLTLTQVTSLPS